MSSESRWNQIAKFVAGRIGRFVIVAKYVMGRIGNLAGDATIFKCNNCQKQAT